MLSHDLKGAALVSQDMHSTTGHAKRGCFKVVLFSFWHTFAGMGGRLIMRWLATGAGVHKAGGF